MGASYSTFLSQLWAHAIFFNTKIVAFEDRRLLIFVAAIYCIFPAFVLNYGIVNRSYQSRVPTDFIFNIDSAQTLVQVDDMIVGNDTNYDLGSLAIRESEDSILVPTRVISALEVYDDCDMNQQDLGLPCMVDEDCTTFHTQDTATCDLSTGLCQFTPYRGWCVRELADTNLYQSKKNLDLLVTARILCTQTTSLIFSNFNRLDKAQQRHYHLRSDDILQEAGLNASSNISDYFDRGIGFLVVYHWMCDLAAHLGRYDCPLEKEVKVLSKTSITSAKTTIYLNKAGPNQKATRQVQTVIGFRFRFVGRGGCYHTTVLSMLAFLASMFALNSLVGMAMGFIIILWKLWYGAPVFGEVYRLVSRGPGRRPQAVLQSWRDKSIPQRYELPKSETTTTSSENSVTNSGGTTTTTTAPPRQSTAAVLSLLRSCGKP